jgi:hypothetical protein
MKVKFETTCSGCRIPYAPHRKRQQCAWFRYGYSEHRYQWRYLISHGDERLYTSAWFRTHERARRSADRRVAKLCITIKDMCDP